MAMVRVEPLEVRVRADWFDGRPREVTLHGRRLRVLEVLGVRNESFVPGGHRAADAVRGRDGGRPPAAGVPPSISSLDRGGNGELPRGLTLVGGSSLRCALRAIAHAPCVRSESCSAAALG